MDLSIITICYNELEVERTCESIVNQSNQDFEWIVIDGGSNQKTLDIFEKYKYRINKFVSEPDEGIYNACNKGINFAAGKYLIFMNAGDSFYSSDVIKSIYPFLDNSTSNVIYGEVLRYYSFGNKKNGVTISPQAIQDDFFITNNICTQGAFIEKKLFDLCGLYNENYKICADYEKWIQFCKAGAKFKYVPVIIAVYDFNGVSSSVKTRELSTKEHNEIKYKYFTEKEIENIAQRKELHFSFIENIFSIKNNVTGLYKIITVLGIHINIRRNHK